MVSANFVIPYPPGFPILVPGQVVTRETVDFMRKLDVKEIHGYEAARGLKLIRLHKKPARAADSRRRSSLGPERACSRYKLETELTGFHPWRWGFARTDRWSAPAHNAMRDCCHGQSVVSAAWEGRSCRCAMVDWLVETLRTYPELAIFVALAIGFWIGPKKLGGFSLGNVTATLLAAIVVGQLGMTVDGPIKSAFFLLFLFAVGYGVGPQFFAGLSKEGPSQIIFALIVCVLCLLSVVGAVEVRAVSTSVMRPGFIAGSQTISASIGVATDQINQLGQDPASIKAILDRIPVGYAVTYIYGTVGSAIIIAQLGPKLAPHRSACCLQGI